MGGAQLIDMTEATPPGRAPPACPRLFGPGVRTGGGSVAQDFRARPLSLLLLLLNSDPRSLGEEGPAAWGYDWGRGPSAVPWCAPLGKPLPSS